MLNTTDFALRLQQVMDYYKLNAAAFADILEIQRSGISHLLSERNKPSLDFILKLIEKFPEVDMYWITQGKGSFPRKELKESGNSKKTQQTDLFSEIPEIEMEASSTTPPLELTATSTIEKSVVAPVSPEEMVMPALTQKEKDGKRIRRIIFFYEDKTFEVFDA